MDPTYPLVPVVSFIAAFLILLTFLTSVRQTWNAGVLMLCVWLFIYCLVQGLETIIWSNNSANKAPVWCDIDSHFSVAFSVGVPACSLVITRRLHNIARLRTVDAPSKRERRIKCFLDLFIGIGFPIIVMGPFYHVVQTRRFQIFEEGGCSAAEISSGLSTVLVDVWSVILPLISAIFYCPQIIRTFYGQHRGVSAFLRRNGTINHAGYFRALAIGCIDILFTLPTGALLLFVQITQDVHSGHYPFYPGWYHTHHPWAPISVSADEWRSDFWLRFDIIYEKWLYLVLSILIFATVGLRPEARTTYRRWFWTAAGLFGVKPTIRACMPNIKFGPLQQRRQTRAPGDGLSMLESNIMDGADLILSMHSPQPHEEIGTHNNELTDGIAEPRC